MLFVDARTHRTAGYCSSLTNTVRRTCAKHGWTVPSTSALGKQDGSDTRDVCVELEKELEKMDKRVEHFADSSSHEAHGMPRGQKRLSGRERLRGVV